MTIYRNVCGAAWAMILPLSTACPTLADEVVLPMFQDHFVSGWESHQSGLPTTTTHAYKGDRSIELKLGSGDGWNRSYQLIYGWTGQFTAEPFDRVEFYIHGGEQGGQTVKFEGLVADPNKRPDRGGHYGAKTIALPGNGKYLEGNLKRIPANQWVKVSIPLADFAIPNPKWFRGFRIHTDSDQRQSAMFIDEINLVGDVAERASVTIDANQTIRQVSGDIFGICTYSTPGADNPGEVAAALDADYEMQRVFYPTFNMRGWNVNIQKGMLFAEATGARMMGTVNWSDQPPKQKVEGQRTGEYGTAEEAAAYVAYANVPVDAPRELLDMKLGVDEHGYDWKTVGYWVDLRANQDKVQPNDGFNDMRIRRAEPWGVKYWELDNEPWLHAHRKDWLAYANWCKEADALMKKVDPSILTGPTIQWNAGDRGKVEYKVRRPGSDEVKTGGNEVIPYFLSGRDERSPGRFVPDFVVVHNYAGGDSGNADLVTLLTHQQAGGGSWEHQVRGIRDLLTAYYGEADGIKPFIACSEWNMRPTFPLSRQYSSMVGALYVANALGAAMQLPENSIEIMTLHDWADGPMDKGGFYENPAIYGWRHETGYGVYRDSGETRYPIHYAFKLLSRYFAEDGDTVVKAETDELMLQPFAVRQQNGNLAVLLINKHPRQAIAADLSFSGFEPGQAMTLHRYGPQQDRAEADIVVEHGVYTDEPITIEPYTMVVATLTGSDLAEAASNAPRGLVAIPGNGQVQLHWDVRGGSPSYDIYRAETNGDWRRLAGGIAEPSYLDTTVRNGERYRYRVALAGQEARSETAPAQPAAAPTNAPDDLIALGADGEVVLTWRPVQGASNYTVKRSMSADGPFEVITTNPYKRDVREQRIRTEHHDREVANGQTYHYQVVATTVGGEGPAVTASAMPAAPPDGWRSIDTTGRTDTGTTIYATSPTPRWILHGEGNGEYDAGDGRFVYKQVRGDFDIRVHVLDAEHGQYGKNNFGVHLRSSLPKNPAFWATMGATSTHSNGFTQGPQFYLWSPKTQRITHREANDRTGKSSDMHVPYWVRLKREGDTVIGLVSKDGQQWREWKRVDLENLPETLHVGLIASSNYPYATARGAFTGLQLDGQVVPAEGR